MINYRELVDAVLDCLPGHHIVYRTAFRAVTVRALQTALDTGRAHPRQTLRHLAELGKVAPHLAAEVAAALGAEPAL
ncbi:hypothetical protein [Pseudonocardia parietis]|uniref:Uncharacterized protein n=1 Tax=Pseudonocardia parietis TaxID=570936 RepID=A0ABS4W2W1_9PSEU|nr:hypothetical protein [Pseudonocardia parietis]MBP2370283.1 hypothetical protein [Pseudonocardia parietis]